MVVTILALARVGVATVTDLRRHEILNRTTYPGMAVALGLNALGSAAVRWAGANPEWLESLGWIGLDRSLLGLAVCGFLMLVCFVLLQVGGGDVKLMAMLGALFGPEKGIETMLWTFVLGAGAAVIVLVWRVGPWRLLTRALRQVLYTIRLGRWSPLSEDERAQLQPPLHLAPSALAAVVIVRFELIGV